MKIRILLLLGLCLTGNLLAHPGHDDDSPVLLAAATTSPAAQNASSGQNQVTITVEGESRVVHANGWPDHTPGQFPNRNNPNRIAAQNYTFRMPLHPQTNATARSGNHALFGVALNGVPFDPGTAEFWSREWNYEAIGSPLNLGLDVNRAHVQPNGAYHYHGLPTGLISKLSSNAKQMLLVGWAADGFPIYSTFGHGIPLDAKSPLKKLRSSYRLKTGERPSGQNGPGGKYDGSFTADFQYVAGSGDLDECNGRFGVTPQFPAGSYHYYLTEEFPFIPRLWRGTPDQSFLTKGGPGGGRGQPGGPGMRPPGPRPGPAGRLPDGNRPPPNR
jgi:hypothetical protein